jgi:NitT/TauT family transport system substrate-binding protein
MQPESAGRFPSGRRDYCEYAGGSARVFFFLSLVLIGCFACRPAEKSPTDSSSGAKRDTVKLQLNWLPDPQFGGFYTAKIQGEYEREGIDVEIVAGGPGSQPIPRVAIGQVEFGVGNADQVLLARQEEAPVVGVMAVMQQSPRCILVHESSGIRSFDQLTGITMALGEGNAFVKVMQAKVPLKDVRIVSYSGSVAKFVQDPQYAQQGYVFSEPIMAKKQGSDPHVLMLSDIGFNPYTGVVVVNEKLIASNPDLVRRFVRASIRGWQAYLDQPAATNAELARLNPDMDVSILEEAIDVIRPLCIPQGFAEADLGKMEATRWEELARQLQEVELLKPNGEEASRAFRLEFIPWAEEGNDATPPAEAEASKQKRRSRSVEAEAS